MVPTQYKVSDWADSDDDSYDQQRKTTVFMWMCYGIFGDILIGYVILSTGYLFEIMEK